MGFDNPAPAVFFLFEDLASETTVFNENTRSKIKNKTKTIKQLSFDQKSILSGETKNEFH